MSYQQYPQGYPHQAHPHGHPQHSYPTFVYPPPGYPARMGYTQSEFRPEGYPPQEYPPQGYPPQGYSPQGYPPQGYPPQGYAPQGHPQGFPSEVHRASSLQGHSNLDTEANPHQHANRSIPKELRTQDQLVVHEAKAIMYSCMDFRLLDDICVFMNQIGLNNNYDQFILAGASLSFVQDRFKHWRKIAKEHLDLAISLHKIREVICVEHEQCGAYKMCYPSMRPEDEKRQHVENVVIFERKLLKSHPSLKMHAYYMHINGCTEKIN